MANFWDMLALNGLIQPPLVAPSPNTPHQQYYQTSRAQQENIPDYSRWSGVLPPSGNIEDRRNDPNWRAYFTTLLGNPVLGGSPEEWARHLGILQNPFNPVPLDSMEGKAMPSQLSQDAGLGSIIPAYWNANQLQIPPQKAPIF